MNAIVGDNGIITQTQQANMMQSCAVLSEYLNQKYIDSELDNIVSYNDDGTEKSALEKIYSKFPDWFFKYGSYSYVLYEYTRTLEDGSAKTDYLTLYLINKSGLERYDSDLTNQLSGGLANGNDLNSYQQLKDVYGVTSDLQVYYCSDGIDSAVGADFTKSSVFDSAKEIYSSNSSLAQSIAETYGKDPTGLNISDLRSTTELVVTPSSGMTDLSNLYELTSLKKLTLKNYTGKLNGIQNIINLNNLYIDNSGGTTNIDYSGLNGATNLTQIYFRKPTDVELEKMMAVMSTADYSKLQTLGLYGYMADWEDPTVHYEHSDNGRSTLTSIASLNSLTDVTKKAIKVLYIQENKLTSLNGIQNMPNITSIRAQWNNFTDISALSSLSNLTDLKMYSCGSGFNSLSALDNLTKLKRIHITGDSNILSLKEIVTNGKTVSRLYATGIDKLDFSENTTFWTEENLNKLGGIEDLKLNSKYSLLFSNKPVITISSDVTDERFKVLKNNKYVSSLDLCGNKNITNATLQEILPTLSSLAYLYVDNSNLESFDWALNVSDKTKLGEISMLNTKISKITQLKGFTGLWRIYANGDNLKIYSATDAQLTSDSTAIIEQLCARGRGFVPESTSLCQQLGNLTDLKTFGFYWGGTLPANIDLTNTGVQTIQCDVYYGGDKMIYVPETIKKIDVHCGAKIYIKSNKNLTYLRTSWSGTKFTIEKNEAADGQIDLIITGPISCNLTNYETCLNSALKSLYYVSTSYREIYRPYNIVNSESLTNCTSAQTMTFGWATFSKLDGADFPDSVKTLTIDSCRISEFKNLADISELTSISLTNNNISSLKDFCNINETSNLTSIDLRNNTLQNYFSNVENGKTVTYNTCSVLAKFSNLKKVYLSGNADLIDYSALINVGFTDDGNHNFTR